MKNIVKSKLKSGKGRLKEINNTSLKMFSATDPHNYIDPNLHLNKNLIEVSKVLEEKIDESIPKIKKIVDSMTYDQIECLKVFHLGGISHGAISYPAHVCVSAAANLLTTFLWARENKSLEKLVKECGPKETFEIIKKLKIYFGKKSIFNSEKDMLFSLNTETELTKKLISVIGMDAAKELLTNLPDYGPMSNSGEGGELFTRDGNIKQSLKRQVASGRFGVNLRYIVNSEVIEIKINQGAKPGVGGQLPGIKVTDEIAIARGATPGIPLISPPPHHDIYSIEDLRQLIFDLRSANPHSKISVKLASNQGVPTVVLGVAKCFAKQFPEDKINITIAGPGGTGAATITDRHEINQPYELGLLRSHQLLLDSGFRDRVTLTASGGIQTGSDVFKALLLGANYVEFGTSILVSLGCLMAKDCHLDTCPTGIATTNYDLINSKFKGTPNNVAQFLVGLTKSLEAKMKLYGIKDTTQITGRLDLLKVKSENATSSLLKQTLKKVSKIYTPENNIFFPDRIGSSNTEKEAINLIESGKNEFTLLASNRVISFGARIGYYNYFKNIIKSPVIIHFEGGNGSLGQSFGYLLPKDLTLTANIVNDYAGKSLSGGELFIRTFAGNGLGYGATEGFIAVGGQGCGDRSCIRLSGKAVCVIRRVSDSACNFMTGGRVTIIGESQFYQQVNHIDKSSFLIKKDAIGANFGSGFTGGKIVLPKTLYYAMNKKGHLSSTILAMNPEQLNENDILLLKNDLKKYSKHIIDPLVDELLSMQDSNFSSQFLKFEDKPPSYDKSKIVTENIIPQTTPLNMNIETKVEVFEPPKTDKDSCGIGVIVKKDQIPERDLVNQITEVLKNLYHRGSIGLDAKAGDGCGITWFGTTNFFQKKFPSLNLDAGNYGVINMCAPVQGDKFVEAKELLNRELEKERLKIQGERFIPTNPEVLGTFAKEILNTYYQFIVLKPRNMSVNDFEIALTKVRLRFCFRMHDREFNEKSRANIMSASCFYQTYTSLVQGENYRHFFIDLEDPEFTANAAIAHERFATNSQTRHENIQPMPRIANNGENNNIRLIERLITEDPTFSQIIGVKPSLVRMSDSAVLSYYFDYYILKYLNKEEINEEEIRNMVMSSIQPYIPKENDLFHTLSNFYNLFGVPFEGPNASIIAVNDTISLVRDRNGFRPLVGLENEKYLFAGSELGCIKIENGMPFRMQTGRCLFINLKNGKFNLSSFDTQDTQIVNALWKGGVQELNSTPDENLIPKYSGEELELKKLQAGWNEEVDKNIIQKLFRNEALLSSMGDHGPIEHFVQGPFLDIFALFKGKFAQVTNPALAKREELSYMSTFTFVGEKPEINKVKEVNSLNGIILSSPILDNEEFSVLLKHPKIKSAVVSINYYLTEFEDGLSKAITRVVDEVLNLVLKQKKNLVVLSDLVNLKNSSVSGPIHPVLIAAIVDRALHNNGVRRNVSIALQSRELLTGPHIAQAISIGGVEIVAPYLPFIRNENDNLTDKEFNQRKKNYKEALRQELLGFMARMGISSVTAYRGAKIFEAEGLEQNVADMYGVGSIYGGIGLHELSYIIFTRYTVPKKKGLGRYDEILRKFIWRPEITQHLLKAIKNEDDSFFAKYEELADKLEIVPLDWLGLVKPTKWSVDNPLPLCIIGAGAAGLTLAKRLLEANYPLKISIFEKNLVNKVGLIGDGVAPDHPGTRKNGDLLAEVMKDPRVTYYGGIQIGSWLQVSEVRKSFSCIVDSRGASDDLKLNIPGENSPLVLSASKVYSSYNATFNPFEENHWPFNKDSVNPIIGIVGVGNVAADIARILLSPVEKLEDTSINKEFLNRLSEHAPPMIHIYARGSPTDCKIGFKELDEFKKLGIWMTAKFDHDTINLDKLNETQLKYLNFFKSIEQRQETSYNEKRLYFYFNYNPEKVETVGPELKVHFKNKKAFNLRNLICALGRKPSKDQTTNADYIVGWATGKGGNLQLIDESVNEVFDKFKQDYESNKFHQVEQCESALNWQFKSLVNNNEFFNIIDYLKEGNQITNLEQFAKARNSKRELNLQQNENEPNINLKELNIFPEKNKLKIYNGTEVFEITPDENSDLLSQVKKLSEKESKYTSILPEHECDGKGTCGTCYYRIIDKEQGEEEEIVLSKNERDLLRINGVKKGVLCCQHKGGDFKNRVLYHAPLKLNKLH